MGTFTRTITLVFDSGLTETVEALVDTGATFSAVPAEVLERLGVIPHREVRVCGWLTARYMTTFG